MILVEEWIAESRDVRTAHIDMSEPCFERGGNSTAHRGILAQYLGTNLPDKIDLCHNCGNGKCSNPKHLYWGTRTENVKDAQRHGTWKNPYDRLVETYGVEYARERLRSVANPAKAGAGNKGKPKTEEHKANIAANRKGGKPKGWKKSNVGVAELV